MRKGYRVIEVISHERARAGGEMKSRVIRHGTRFLVHSLGRVQGSETGPGRY